MIQVYVETIASHPVSQIREHAVRNATQNAYRRAMKDHPDARVIGVSTVLLFGDWAIVLTIEA